MPEFGYRPGIKKAVNLWNTAFLSYQVITILPYVSF